jgi:hypothetical protein
VVSIICIDELSRHPNAVSRAAHTAFKNRPHTERFSDFPDVLFLSPESES